MPFEYSLKLTAYEMLILKDDMENRLKYNRGFTPEEMNIYKKICALYGEWKIDDAEYKRRESEEAK